MKKIGKKYFIISDDVFKIHLNVFLNFTFDELNRFLVKRKFPPIDEKFKHSNGIALGWYKENDTLPYFTIWLPNFEWTLTKQAIMVHELSHFIFMAMDNKGMKVDEDVNKSANETYAYLLEYFFLKLSRKIDSYKH
jgi:hypothetical protein